jgi:hypothetical protein
MEPMVNDAANAVACDVQEIGDIRYNTGTAAFEGCNGTAWADIRNGATAAAAGSTGEVQFNSGGLLGASANLFWDNVNGRLGIGTATPATALDIVGAYGINGNTILALPDADTSSIAVGENALQSQSATGLQNVAVGNYALYANTTGTDNTAVGSALGANTTGNYNTAVGFAALLYSTGSPNTAVGGSAGGGITSGTANTALGTGAMQGSGPITGNDNTAVGDSALSSITGAAPGNTAVGSSALLFNSAGTYNTGVGYAALESNTSGTDNVAVGPNALDANTTGTYNTAVGSDALYGGSGGTESYETAVGDNTLYSDINGSENVAIGDSALYSNTSGSYNVALGDSALWSSTADIQNIAIGAAALLSNNGGTDNTALGYGALQSNTTGSNNTALGDSALYVNYTGSNNTVLGWAVADSTLHTGSNNILIGTDYSTDTVASSSSNTLNIGNAIYGTNLQNHFNTGGTPNITIGGNLTVTGTCTGCGSAGVAWNAITNPTGNLSLTMAADTSLFTYNATTGANDLFKLADTTNNTGTGYLLNASTASGSHANPLHLSAQGTTDLVFTSAGRVGMGTTAPGTALDVNGAVTLEPTSVTLTSNNTVLATANRSYFQVTSDNTTETNRIFCFGAGTLGQVLIVEWTSPTNRGEIVNSGNCGGAAGAVAAKTSINWAPRGSGTILELIYNGTNWLAIAGSANFN